MEFEHIGTCGGESEMGNKVNRSMKKQTKKEDDHIPMKVQQSHYFL